MILKTIGTAEEQKGFYCERQESDPKREGQLSEASSESNQHNQLLIKIR